MLVGALAMVAGMVSPAMAWPHTAGPQGNAYANGQDNGNGLDQREPGEADVITAALALFGAEVSPKWGRA